MTTKRMTDAEWVASGALNPDEDYVEINCEACKGSKDLCTGPNGERIIPCEGLIDVQTGPNGEDMITVFRGPIPNSEPPRAENTPPPTHQSISWSNFRHHQSPTETNLDQDASSERG